MPKVSIIAEVNSKLYKQKLANNKIARAAIDSKINSIKYKEKLGTHNLATNGRLTVCVSQYETGLRFN
jgi:hypothetical protein